MDIVVTTPADRAEEAAEEVAACLWDGGGCYFRWFSNRPRIHAGERIFYVETGYVRGFAQCDYVTFKGDGVCCETTGHLWPRGWYVFMRADSWKWIKPIPMRGFQGYRYAHKQPWFAKIEIVGGWKDPMPKVK